MTLTVLENNYRILSFLPCHRPRTVTSHRSALMEERVGSKSECPDISATLHFNEQYYRTLDRDEFSKNSKYVISCIIDRPKQSIIGLNFPARLYGYDSKIDVLECISQILRKLLFANCKRESFKCGTELTVI